MGHIKVSKLRRSQKYIKSFSYSWHGSGRNSNSDLRTFRNCDMTRFEIQTGDMHTPPNRASHVDEVHMNIGRCTCMMSHNVYICWLYFIMEIEFNDHFLHAQPDANTRVTLGENQKFLC